jgi:hypothetical protein
LDKAHLIVHQARMRACQWFPIAAVSAFYALTGTSSGWKFLAFSDITVHATAYEMTIGENDVLIIPQAPASVVAPALRPISGGH